MRGGRGLRRLGEGGFARHGRRLRRIIGSADAPRGSGASPIPRPTSPE
ncbi:hypothetical protein RGE_29040 [Rubrivivax gelatinosus IL144]|uniref:Uncharacterized protein n=1 Tax=Rubrivivax gelatinosus (strain NBRC 100245 / IL144) TaxID=983917 RepID=I0HTA6_RUBGI|nr:hypothetical protein RGE_29040 [Rubrivivax gelatinosus IL144]